MFKIDYPWERIKATIKPYNPKASAKIKIKIIPTKIPGCWELHRTPTSPTIPIAYPAAYFDLYVKYHKEIHKKDRYL